jgi:hypothetical protein
VIAVGVIEVVGMGSGMVDSDRIGGAVVVEEVAC